jgi:transcriptional regulator of arginine metabolism
VVGSLAGDDTVLLIMRTNEDAADFCRELQTMVQ